MRSALKVDKFNCSINGSVNTLTGSMLAYANSPQIQGTGHETKNER